MKTMEILTPGVVDEINVHAAGLAEALFRLYANFETGSIAWELAIAEILAVAQKFFPKITADRLRCMAGDVERYCMRNDILIDPPTLNQMDTMWGENLQEINRVPMPSQPGDDLKKLADVGDKTWKR